MYLQHHKRLWARLFLSGIFFLWVSGSEAKENEIEQVTLQLKWTHQFQFAGYYMAQQLGYYRDAGLEVDIRAGTPTMDVTEEVLSGRADFGVGTSSLLLDYAAGKPVVVLGVIYQHSPLVLIMSAESPSDTLEKLIDRPVMLEAHSGDLLAMFRRQGLPLDQLNILDRPVKAENLLKSQPGAISAYLTDEPYTLDRMAVDYVIGSPRTYGIDFYGDNFFTTKNMIQTREDVVERFREASLRGWEEALKNPERAIDLILEKYPNNKTREHLLYEARITQDLMTKLVSPGFMLSARWQHIADTYLEVGMLKNRPKLKGFIFKAKSPALPTWFWTSTFGGASLILLLTSISIHLRILNIRLEREVVRRRKAEEFLKIANRELVVAKEISEEASHKKTRFIADVSHDLRAPISALISLAHIFQHHGKTLELPEKFSRFLRLLQSGSEFLMLMLNNILDFSVFEMDAAHANPEPVSLDECCADISNIALALADEKEIKIEIIQRTEQKDLEIDRNRLSLILLNLLHNAIKYSPRDGTVSLELTLLPNRLKIKVQDQGSNIRPEELEDISTLFAKGKRGTAHRSGTGLGLAIVHRNTELLQGTIQVEQAQPTGTIFTVDIPLEPNSSFHPTQGTNPS